MLKELGNKIKQLRLKSGRGQTQVANALGISVAALSKIENGLTDCNYSRLLQIAQYFDVPLFNLFGGQLVADKGDDNCKQEIQEKNEQIIALQQKLIALYEKK